MTIRGMVEEMYHQFKKNKYEGTPSPKDQEDKGKREMLPPPSPPSLPSSSSSSSSSHKSSPCKKKNKKSFVIKLDVKFDLPIYDGERNVEKLDNWIRQIEVYCRVQKIVSERKKI